MKINDTHVCFNCSKQFAWVAESKIPFSTILSGKLEGGLIIVGKGEYEAIVRCPNCHIWNKLIYKT